jgi:chromate transporter
MQTHRLAEVAGLFLRLGFTAFGGPAAHIAMMRDEVVERRKWISNERFLDLLGVINLIPGPNSTQLAIYLGYIRAGWAGLLLGGICFIGPAMLIVMTLAWLYTRYGTLPQTTWLLYGIKPVVIAIIAQALWGLSRTALKKPLPIIFALLILILFLLGLNTLVLLLGGGLLFGLLRWLERCRKEKILSLALPCLPFNRHAGLLTNISPEISVALTTVPVSLPTLFLTFLKIGSVLYGGGYVLLAFLQDDFVKGLGWLTERQLLDAVSIGQFTPGPLFTTATFIGYLVEGWQGALVATFAIFLPSFVFIAIIHPLAPKLRSSPWTAPILDGVNIAALALLAGVLLQLGQSALTDVPTWAIALVSLAVLLRFKINSAWLILAGALLGFLRFSL